MIKTSGLIVLLFLSFRVLATPSVCSVVKAPQFRSCLSLTTSPSMCGFPPRPCAYFSYYVPQYYIEVVENPRETFFSGLPGVGMQLVGLGDVAPFGGEESNGSYSFHSHSINVPYSSWAFNELPCGGAQFDRYCFSAMSEHLGRLWKTGEADLYQPAFLAWSAAPKACLIKGALSSAPGTSVPAGGAGWGNCSWSREGLRRFPPSSQPICTGWGVHFPRYGTVTSSDPTTASLVIASRLRSLGAEVFQSVPTSGDEKWQMISPQTSSCFREGQNVALLRTKNVSEWARLWKGKTKSYLYVVWKRVSCTQDIPWIATTQAWLAALQGACGGIE